MSDPVIYLHSSEDMRELGDESVHMICSSPPYWGLRDYGCDGQIGLELSLDEFVERLMVVFREAKRVLRRDGSLWINIGDCFFGDSPVRRSASELFSPTWDPSQTRSRGGKRRSAARSGTLRPKSLVGLPWRLAQALQADGWIWRGTIVIAKPSPMPEPVADRPTRSHEYVLMFAKSERYYYDRYALERGASVVSAAVGTPIDAEPVYDVWPIRPEPYTTSRYECAAGHVAVLRGRVRDREDAPGKPDFRCPRCCEWTKRTIHPAPMPRELVRRCILLGTSSYGACTTCGAPYVRSITSESPKRDDDGRTRSRATDRMGKSPAPERGWKSAKIMQGWRATCACKAPAKPCVVLDPFLGSGTVAEVAIKYGRAAIGYEINAKYLDFVKHRLNKRDVA